MEVVIQKEKLRGHIIHKYKFKALQFDKALASDSGAQTSEVFTPMQFEDNFNENSKQAEINALEPEEKVAEQHDDVVGSVLKRADEISSNFVKLQMKLEAQEEQHKADLQNAKDEFYEKGVEDGRRQFQEESEKAQNSLSEQLINSIRVVDATVEEFKKASEVLQDELISVALDMAKEVIILEVSSSSEAIATAIGKALIKEVKDAAKIILKVNPSSVGKIQTELANLSNVEVVAESAVSEGGVIVISDSGNIEGEIMTRYERVKQAATEED